MSSAAPAPTADQLHQALLQYLSALSAAGASDANGIKDAEPLDIAVQCVSEATGVSLNRSSRLVHASLPELFARGVAAVRAIESHPKWGAFLATLQSGGEFFGGLEANSLAYAQRMEQARNKFVDKFGAEIGAAPGAATAAAAAQPAQPTAAPELSAETKAQAEAAKNAGNAALQAGNHREAVAKYSDAIALNPAHAIYYANRAAAHINLKDFVSAAADCRRSIELDPHYAKAHYRLGQALAAQNEHAAALPSFERALSLSGKDEGMAVTIREQIRLAKDKLNPPKPVAPSGGADPMSALGGMDFGSLLNNPSLAGLMNSPELAGLMQNPALQDMMRNFDLGSIMKDMAQAPQRVEEAAAAVEQPKLNTDYKPDAAALFDDEPAAAATPAASPAQSAANPSSSGASSANLPPQLAAFLSTPAGQQLASDPDLRPVLDDMSRNGVGAAMKYMGNPKVMSKIQGMMGPIMAAMGRK